MPSTAIRSIAASPARHLLAAERRARQVTPTGLGPQRVLAEGQNTVRWLLARFALIREDRPGADQARGGVVRRLCAELAVHLHIEEALLFPHLRDMVRDAAPVDEAEIEHECLRDQMERLMDMQPDDPLFGARVMVLGHVFENHLQRELTQVLPLLRATGLRDLGLCMANRRDDLLAELAERADGRRRVVEDEQSGPAGPMPH